MPLIGAFAAQSTPHTPHATQHTHPPLYLCPYSLSHTKRWKIARLLAWHASPHTHNLCDGYYRDPWRQTLSHDLATHISADQASFARHGPSVLRGHVVVLHQQQEMRADTAHVTYDATKHTIKIVDLYGHVQLYEPGKLLLGDKAHWNNVQHTAYINNALYRIKLNRPSSIHVHPSIHADYAWGHAKHISRDKKGNYTLEQASYTTCPPLVDAWQLNAKRLIIDRQKEIAIVYGGYLRLHGVPLAYLPYYNFPIGKQRRSGFLFPSLTYSHNNGVHFSLPYYWNMAPNYDSIVTPQFYSRRGFMLGDNFRYLSKHHQGHVQASWMPVDRAFKTFKQDYSLSNPTHTQRFAVQWENTSHLTDHWSSYIHYETVSDDYYLQDFGSNLITSTDNQLPHIAHLSYTAPHWYFQGGVEAYKTLHPVNQSTTSDTYSRLPQLLLSNNERIGNLDWNIDSEFDNFIWSGDDDSSHPEGIRLLTNPSLSHTFYSPATYFTPSAQLSLTHYNLSHQLTGLPSTIDRAVPLLSFDTATTFERNTSVFKHAYRQTLQPRLYYLFAPYVNQNQIPNFDTSYTTFTYDQLFRNNRFSGSDRIGDANQVALGVSTHYFDQKTRQERLSASIGQLYYLKKRGVQLCQITSVGTICTDDASTTSGYTSSTAFLSPIVATSTLHITPHISGIANLAWDTSTHAVNNSDVNLHYQASDNRILDLGYSFLRNGDNITLEDGSTSYAPLQQISLTYAWPLSSHWSSLGSWSYNLSHRYPMSYALGLQYESCCWALRLLGRKHYTSLDTDNGPVFSKGVYIQFLLKGLGSLANANALGAMSGSLAGYRDIF